MGHFVIHLRIHFWSYYFILEFRRKDWQLGIINALNRDYALGNGILQKIWVIFRHKKLWAKDPALWKNEPQHQKIIKNSLGWLFVADKVLENLDELLNFTEEVKKDGVEQLLLF